MLCQYPPFFSLFIMTNSFTDKTPTAVPNVTSGSLFNLSFANIRGLHGNLNHVHHLLQLHKPRLLFLTETQISPPLDSTHLQCPGYILHHCFRFKAGVCAFVHSSIPATRLPDFDICCAGYQLLWLKVSLPRHSKIYCCIYRSPNCNDYVALFTYLTTSFESLILQYPSCEIIILGDFNVHNAEWLTYSKGANRAGIEAESFAIINGLTQLITSPTRIPDRASDSANTLDLFLTTDPNIYKPAVVSAPIGSSDHSMITLTHLFNSFDHAPQQKRRLWNYSNADWYGLRGFYSSFPWDEIAFSADPSATAMAISEIILLGMEVFIPFSVKAGSSSSPSWFNRQCATAIRHKNNFFQAWLSSPSEATRQAYVNSRTSCCDLVNETKNAFILRMANKLTSCPTGGRSFWSLAKSVSKNFCTSQFPPLKNPDGSLASDASSKANIFAKMFSSNSTVADSTQSPPSFPRFSETITTIPFTTRLVRQTMLILDTKKASGPDGIPPIVLKNCAPELAPILGKLYRLSYSMGCYPSVWKHAHVCPVPKKGTKSDPSNYRPIAITSILSKVMETIINKHVLNFLESHALISDHQYGFRHGRSTGDLLAFVTNQWAQAIDSFGECRVIALDIAKAFDRVWHAGLLSKLPSFGFNPTLISWTKSFLSGRSISVRVDGALSETFPINAGVPQGCVLSPTLFLIFINDLLSSTTNSIHSFADDSTLHQSLRFPSHISQANIATHRTLIAGHLNADLDSILEWGYANLVTFNQSKTQNLLISFRRDSNVPFLSMAEKILSQDAFINTLGMEITKNLCWNSHIKTIATRASQKLGFLFRARKYFTPPQLLLIYKAQIRSLLEYGCHIWGGASLSALSVLDRLQRKAIRLINDDSITNTLQSLSHRRTVSSLCLLYRYFHGHCSSELRGAVPPLFQVTRTTRASSSGHPFRLRIPHHRTETYARSFFPRTSRVWNMLPRHVFPPAFNLQLFKSRINRLDLSSS